VIAKLPTKRQTLFFSATMPKEIAGLADSILTDPVKVAVTPVSSTAEKVTQSVFFVEKQDKRHLLNHLLKDQSIKSALVFTRTKHGANKVAADLLKSNTKAEAIHGNKSQNARQAALSGFKSGRIRVLVATDIAARGIDIDDLSHVVNFDLPNIPETYVHRIGRTGRAGASGIAISFCDREEVPYLKDIQKLTGQLVPVVTDHPFPTDLSAPAMPSPVERRPQNNQQRRPQPANNRPSRPSFSPKLSNASQGTPKQESRQNENRPQREQQVNSTAPSQHKQKKREETRRFEQKNGRDNFRPNKKEEEQNTTSPLFPERKNRFASILEVAKLEKQPSINKPKPNYEGKRSDGPKGDKPADQKNKQRQSWRGNDRVKKSGR
jgi:ATP-dependent RNA helicase RhlE